MNVPKFESHVYHFVLAVEPQMRAAAYSFEFWHAKICCESLAHARIEDIHAKSIRQRKQPIFYVGTKNQVCRVGHLHEDANPKFWNEPVPYAVQAPLICCVFRELPPSFVTGCPAR